MNIKLQELDRKEYQGTKPPRYLTDLLTKIGGTNVYGEPNFRLVRAEERLTPSGGVWLTWLPGTSAKDRNSRKNAPYKRSIEIRMIKRYGPAEGWALEKWVPAKAYGTRERWYSPASIGGTILFITGQGHEMNYVPSQGEYPSRGDYEYTGFLFQSNQLAEATVVTAMQQLIQDLEALPTDPLKRIAQRSAIARAAAEAADRQYTQWGNDLIDERMPAFGFNPMVGFGTKRPRSVNEVAKRLGIRNHVVS